MATTNFYSPLRYPGGKGKMSPFFKDVIAKNELMGCVYYELYAGGSAVALDLLISNFVKRIVLNDADFHIYAFWYAILNDTDRFLRRLERSKVSIQAWKRHRNIYLDYLNYSQIDVAFATFFLNRSNRSGILTKAGPIGGIKQEGNYLIDARFNKKGLIKRISKIAEYSNNISIYNLDSLLFIQQFQQQFNNQSCFIYLDPPYYKKGSKLYLNYYSHQDHVNIANSLGNIRNLKWILTYDYVNEIEDLYSTFKKTFFTLNYSLQTNRKTQEIMILSDNLVLPNNFIIPVQTNQQNIAI